VWSVPDPRRSWHADRMDASPGPDEADEAERRRIQSLRERRAPENEVPVSVAFDAVLVSTEDLAVYVSGLRVFGNGVDFALELRARRREADRHGELHEVLHGRRRSQLLVGVEFSDGRRCSNVGLRLLEAHGDEPTLWPGGGGGGGRTADLSLFLSPLPPPGELRLVTAWPGQGIPDTVTLLPTEEILDAADRVTELWPWEPEVHEATPPERPEVPDDSWFAVSLPLPRDS
jgi:hypothetical protein